MFVFEEQQFYGYDGIHKAMVMTEYTKQGETSYDHIHKEWQNFSSAQITGQKLKSI